MRRQRTDIVLVMCVGPSQVGGLVSNKINLGGCNCLGILGSGANHEGPFLLIFLWALLGDMLGAFYILSCLWPCIVYVICIVYI